SLTDDRVGGFDGPAGRLVTHHAQPLVPELREQGRGSIRRAVVDDEHLDVGRGLPQAAVDCRAQGGLAVARCDGEGDAWGMRVHAGSIGITIASLENGTRIAFGE
ncbi:MAG: hypothetical protein QOH15_2502, partial [Gaiellales bacterium]|nr:hypothetical protein [Gaiellales bacterium]